MDYSAQDGSLRNPITQSGLDTEHWVAIWVLGSLFGLWAIRRGFRGINVGGVGVSVR